MEDSEETHELQMFVDTTENGAAGAEKTGPLITVRSAEDTATGTAGNLKKKTSLSQVVTDMSRTHPIADGKRVLCIF